MRHYPGLAASPPVCYRLGVARNSIPGHFLFPGKNSAHSRRVTAFRQEALIRAARAAHRKPAWFDLRPRSVAGRPGLPAARPRCRAGPPRRSPCGPRSACHPARHRRAPRPGHRDRGSLPPGALTCQPSPAWVVHGPHHSTTWRCPQVNRLCSVSSLSDIMRLKLIIRTFFRRLGVDLRLMSYLPSRVELRIWRLPCSVRFRVEREGHRLESAP
jgi:hypothetical protein